MAAGAWVLHDKAKKYIGAGSGGIDLDGDTFKCFLATSSSNGSTASVDGMASLTNECSGNGYSQQTLTSVTWTESSGTVTWDCADITFTASGGSITARIAGVFDDTVTTPVAEPIVAHCLLDSTPADVTITNGNSLVIQTPSQGIFQSA